MSELIINSIEETDNLESSKSIPKMVTINELSELANISTYAIRKLVRTNQIIYFKSGSKVLINFDKFIDFLNGKQ